MLMAGNLFSSSLRFSLYENTSNKYGFFNLFYFLGQGSQGQNTEQFVPSAMNKIICTIYVCLYTYKYIDIYIERERERESKFC